MPFVALQFDSSSTNRHYLPLHPSSNPLPKAHGPAVASSLLCIHLGLVTTGYYHKWHQLIGFHRQAILGIKYRRGSKEKRSIIVSIGD